MGLYNASGARIAVERSYKCVPAAQVSSTPLSRPVYDDLDVHFEAAVLG
ncbi:hypothetical protein [Streptomyces europaeiscabiei]|nr:hypothetical protein [Streptomyces europaeiscabiei]MDX3835861.1 hypothetical protein [Streptomyces europaeiscabiei]